MSIFHGSEDLQLNTSLQHLEEHEAEEDQKRRDQEVLKPKSLIKHCNQMVRICSLYLRGPGLDSWPRDWLCPQCFLWSPSGFSLPPVKYLNSTLE